MSDFDKTWQAADLKVAIPADWTDLFSKSGPLPPHYDCRRAHPRFYLPAKALLTCEGQAYAGYVRDISRSGMGILAPVQFLPLQHVGVSMPDGRQLKVDIARCVRMGNNCYQCGTRFV